MKKPLVQEMRLLEPVTLCASSARRPGQEENWIFESVKLDLKNCSGCGHCFFAKVGMHAVRSRKLLRRAKWTLVWEERLSARVSWLVAHMKGTGPVLEEMSTAAVEAQMSGIEDAKLAIQLDRPFAQG